MPVPDRVMVKRLKEYDDKLYVDFDFGKERWVVHRKSDHMCGPTTPIMVVQNEDGSFRPLDMRTLQALKDGDMWRNENLIEEMDANNRKIEEEGEADFRDYVRQAAKEDLYKAWFGSRQSTGWGSGRK